MHSPNTFRFNTLALHAGQQPDPKHGARAVPLYLNTAYVFENGQHAASLFNLEQEGHVYSRISNPTVAVFEERMAALEGGVAALATSSGQAALFACIATLASAGDEIVASTSLYGGSHNLLTNTLSRFGIGTRFFAVNDVEALNKAITPRTRLVLAETVGNPEMLVLNIEAIAQAAHAHGVPLLVDNTFATPYLCRPIAHGADLVMHSATKFIGGHGTALAGVLVDGGRFDWRASGRFDVLTQPSPSYHGVCFVDAYEPCGFAMKARLETLRDFGCCLEPMSAFLMLQGLETLSMRMTQHMQNTQKILTFLTEHDAVTWVKHPNLPDSPNHALGQHYLPKGAGAVLAFGVRGGRNAGQRLIEGVTLFSHVANVGDAKSLIVHPASTTHQQMSKEAMQAGGITEDMVRLSVGLEDSEDLLEDLNQALKYSQKN